MVFTDKNGKIYEVPNERYAEFEVSGQRAKIINEEIKSITADKNNEVSGYAALGPGWECYNTGTKINDSKYFKKGTVCSYKGEATFVRGNTDTSWRSEF